MTYGEAKAFVAMHLRGDHSNAVPEAVHFKAALLDVATRCEPDRLTLPFEEGVTDLFRRVPGDPERYVRFPVVDASLPDDGEMDIDEALGMAAVFFICSYMSNKAKDRFEAKAERVVSIYVSNQTG